MKNKSEDYGENDNGYIKLKYDFTGKNDIVSFIKQVQQQGIYVSLRIGPFIEAEWSYGGLPFWLHDVPGIVFRTNNQQFKLHMQNFTTKIVNVMKAENLFDSQGGPIILSQVKKPTAPRKGIPKLIRMAA